MSRDVAYRTGYLPLFAGAELVRRSGSLTQFPAENLIGTLPPPHSPGTFKFRAPPELVGQPAAFGMPNSLFEAYQLSANILPSVNNHWPFTGYTPAGVVPEVADYLRLQMRVPNVEEGGAHWLWRPGTHTGVYSDSISGVVDEPYTSTLTVSGVTLAPSGVVYPTGIFDTLDDYLAACGMPELPNDDTQYFTQTHEMTWSTPNGAGWTGTRVSQTGKSSGTVGASLEDTWTTAYIDKPYPAGLFDPTNSVQGLFGNIGVLYAQIYNAPDEELTEFGLANKQLLRALNPSAPVGALSVVGMPFRDPATLSPVEQSYLVTFGVDNPSLLPGTIPRQSIGFVGPTYKAVSVTFCAQHRNNAGVWGEVSCGAPQTVGGLVAANVQNALGAGVDNIAQTQLFLPTALVEQIYVEGT